MESLKSVDRTIILFYLHLCYFFSKAKYETQVVDIATGITAKATHRNNRSTALKDALKNVVEQLNERGDIIVHSRVIKVIVY